VADLPAHPSGYTHRVCFDPAKDCGTYAAPPGRFWAEVWSGGRWLPVGPWRLSERQARIDARVNADFWEHCNPGLRCPVDPVVVRGEGGGGGAG
jgi:hypothetical protein